MNATLVPALYSLFCLIATRNIKEGNMAKKATASAKSVNSSSTTTAASDTVVHTPVHPIARKVAALLSPMSHYDQKLCFTWCQRVMYTTGLVLYPVAWFMGTFRVFAFGVLIAAGVCCILFVPNWYQQPDPEMTFVDKAVTTAYYERLRLATSEGSDEEAAVAGGEGKRD